MDIGRPEGRRRLEPLSTSGFRLQLSSLFLLDSPARRCVLHSLRVRCLWRFVGLRIYSASARLVGGFHLLFLITLRLSPLTAAGRLTFFSSCPLRASFHSHTQTHTYIRMLAREMYMIGR